MSSGALARRLGLTDAVAIGLGSMVGAGVFAAFAPAAATAGSGLLIGLALAGIVAFMNATSSAQLAAQHPTSGGSYVYGREQIGPWAGFAAGWSFIVGKTASCAAMALVAAAYAAPPGWEKPVAVAVVLLLATVNSLGVTRTAAETRIIVVIVIAVLLIAVAAAALSGSADPARLAPTEVPGGALGILQSAGILFFAFAGYARIATMGEEVRTPERTIPRAVAISLSLALVLYAVVAVTLLATLGPDRLAASAAPLADAAALGGWLWTEPIVRAGAAVASLGALLALIAGIGRTSLAMARTGDLPRWFAAVHPRFQVPHRAELTLAVVVSALILVTDVRGAIGFSSFGVLLYYLIANVAAFRQGSEHRRYPRAMQVVGAIGCGLLAASLPWQSIVGGVLVLAVGLAVRAVRLRVRVHGS
jgi:APA family basic amino acid/polyamine antiporter